MTDTVLRLTGITKRFGALVANHNISLSLQRGEVLALLGENGAGKSTLVSILFGHYVADAGQIEVFGQPLPPGQPRAALAAGIGMVHQHAALADNLSVLDNVILGTEPLWQPYSRRRAARERLLDAAQRFGLSVNPEAHVASLSVGERQRVEILKALVRGARILILDEPTAVLTPQECEALFDTLGRMVAQGLSIIFISHKLAEVLRVSQRVAVLRGGRLVAEVATAQTSQAELAQAMVGHAVNAPVRTPARGGGAVVCALHEARTEGQGRERLDGVNLTLRAGEITAIAGISGHGQAALAELLCGMRRLSSGRCELQGQALRPQPAWLVQHGVARVPEDRRDVGLVGDLPVWENALSERLRSREFSRGGWVRRAAAWRHAKQVTEAFDVRGAGIATPARALSGGNMQKLILGRALMAPDGQAPQLIVAHQPSWGLDIGAVVFVQQQLISARDAGAAVLLISDDLDEVLALGDQVAVMHAGQLTPTRAPEGWTRESIGLAMAGVHNPVRAEPVEALTSDHPEESKGRADPSTGSRLKAVEALSPMHGPSTGSGRTVGSDAL